jgi:hypothetical protein
LVNDFESPEKKIDELLKRKDRSLVVPKSEGLKKIFDNITFAERVKDDPLLLKKEYKGNVSNNGGFRVINLNNFLNLRLYPRSIYTTDKLLRLVASARYEQLKKHINQKRKVPMNMLWIIAIIFGVVIAVVVILMLLPKFMGG